MKLDLAKVPFSRFGSYLAFSQLTANDERPAGLYLRTVRGVTQHREIFRLEVLHQGEVISFTPNAQPLTGRLELETSQGAIELCLAENNVVRLRGRGGVGLRLVMQPVWFDNAIPLDAGRWQVNSFTHRHKYMLTSVGAGRLEVDAPWQIDRSPRVVADFLPDLASGEVEGVIEEFLSSWQARSYSETFDQEVSSYQTHLTEWLKKLPDGPSDLAEAQKLAGYITWSAVAAPAGYLTRPAMYMSKNWMPQVWSWDHCFNALGLVSHQPELAWQQFMLPFDHQDASGVLPDSLTDTTIEWNFCKPPIHGWALKRLLKQGGELKKSWLNEIYEPLSRWTNWWFNYRTSGINDLPAYYHGNDSGWDNSTVFAKGGPVESPDLIAFLVYQMDVLAEAATQLDHPDEAANWKARADALLEKLTSQFWQTDHFVARFVFSGETINSQSLLMFMPLVLGNRLPALVRNQLITALKQPGAFLSEYGLATEHQASQSFDARGYWRGSIWAPVTLLLIAGLVEAGEIPFAQTIARRFCKMAANNGFTENYDAVSGEGLCDPGYTWSANVFLLLAYEEINGLLLT